MAGSSPVPSPAVSESGQAPPISTEVPLEQNLLRRSQHLAIVLWVSFAIPITRSAYYFVSGATTTPAYTPLQQRYRLAAGLIEEVRALFLLWYVMGRQGKTRADIGWNPQVTDVLRATGLFLLVMVARRFVYYQVQYLYYAYSGHYLAGRSLQSVLGFGISFLSVAYACLNPFCEELIVRAYAMSEILNLGGSRTAAVIVSLAVQLSYHFYQGG
jgi:membrane protease YdiL (CAAX protease family)